MEVTNETSNSSETKKSDESPKREKNHDSLRRYYEKNLQKGIILNRKELIQYCRKRKLPLPSKTFLETMQLEYKSVALRKPFNKPKIFAGPAIERYASSIFIDYAEIYRKFKNINRGMVGKSLKK